MSTGMLAGWTLALALPAMAAPHGLVPQAGAPTVTLVRWPFTGALSDPAGVAIEDGAREFGDRVRVVTEEYGNSRMARRHGVRLKGERVTGLDVNDVRAAAPAADGPDTLPALPTIDIAGAGVDHSTLRVEQAVQAAARPAMREPPKRVEVAPGVHLFMTAPYGDVGLDGNSIAVVGSEGVVIFDSNGTPAAAAAVLAEVRRLTTLPVRYLVQSHWHWDHWYGAEVYRQAFPDLKIVAHEKTRAMMMGPALEFNRPGLEKGLPGYLRFLDERVAKAEAGQPPPVNLAALRHQRDEARFFLEQKAAVRHTYPDVTFTNRLDLSLGDRQVQVLHYGRAVTPGDAFLYLPRERIIVTGDLLVNPISFALSSYPTEWLKVLERIDALDAGVMVPGHGGPLHDRALLRATMEVFRVLLREGRAAKAKGLDPDQAGDAIMPGLESLMTAMTGGEPRLKDAFRTQLVDWYLHRVYDELNGPLSDAIAPIPEK